MTKLYTKTGDAGETGLAGNRRVGKDDARIHAVGEVDETNACLGLAACQAAGAGFPVDRLREVQADLFAIGTRLADPTSGDVRAAIRPDAVTQLEGWIDDASQQVDPLTRFILPGGSELSARLHLARAVCRRAERAVVRLGREQTVDPTCLVYLNRLSDLLFVWARWANRLAGMSDIPWRGSV